MSKLPRRERTGVKFGKFRGPTGRIRDLYDTSGFGKDGKRIGRKETYSYGYDSIRVVRKAIRKKAPAHSAIKFATWNMDKHKRIGKMWKRVREGWH